jgi:hypothetical protein
MTLPSCFVEMHSLYTKWDQLAIACLHLQAYNESETQNFVLSLAPVLACSRTHATFFNPAKSSFLGNEGIKPHTLLGFEE